MPLVGKIKKPGPRLRGPKPSSVRMRTYADLTVSSCFTATGVINGVSQTKENWIQKVVMGGFSKDHHARLHVAFSNGSLVQAPQTMKPKRELFKRIGVFTLITRRA